MIIKLVQEISCHLCRGGLGSRGSPTDSEADSDSACLSRFSLVRSSAWPRAWRVMSARPRPSTALRSRAPGRPSRGGRRLQVCPPAPPALSGGTSRPAPLTGSATGPLGSASLRQRQTRQCFPSHPCRVQVQRPQAALAAARPAARPASLSAPRGVRYSAAGRGCWPRLIMTEKGVTVTVGLGASRCGHLES